MLSTGPPKLTGIGMVIRRVEANGEKTKECIHAFTVLTSQRVNLTIMV